MRKDLLLILVIVATLALMVLPMSQRMIDILLSINISLSVLLLLVAVYLKHPSDFSTFPSVILLGTAFRLALSVGTTRLILSEADAGQIVETFGQFVVSGSIVIGLVIFLIITVVQFLVVTKGAERVAEVGARFALDALPGKQMSIDAEVRAGNLEPEDAAVLRKRLDVDSQFFGAMDGAMKFVKGDAIAGLIIICINLIGGVAVGISLHGYTFGEAIGIFSLLTVGDGLVAQIPALLMSLCAGVIVTRVAKSDNEDLGTDISRELVSDPRVPAVAALIVLAVGFIPGFPTVIFAVLAFVLVGSAMAIRRAMRRETVRTAQVNAEIAVDAGATDAPPTSSRFKVYLGESLVSDETLQKIRADLGEQFAALNMQRGVLFPATFPVMDPATPPHDLLVELDEVPIYRTSVPADSILVCNDGSRDLPQTLASIMPAEHVDDAPVAYTSNVLSGFWMPDALSERISDLGLTLMTPEEVITWTAFRLYEQHLGTLFSLAVFKDLIAGLHAAEPETMALIEEEMTEIALQKMFRYLIEDGVPLRPVSLLVSSLHYWVHTAENPTSVTLAECLRGSLKRQICHRIAGKKGLLGVALLDPEIEMLARQSQLGPTAAHTGIVFDPETSVTVLNRIRALANNGAPDHQPTALVVSAELRRILRNYLAANDIHIPVLSPHEVASEVATLPVGLISLSMPDKRATRTDHAVVSADRPQPVSQLQPAV